MAKRDKRKMMTKIIVLVLVGLMLFGTLATLIFSIIG